MGDGSAYEIAESISYILSDKYNADNFDDLWTYVEMMLEYDILTYDDVEEKYEYEEDGYVYHGCNAYRIFLVNA